MTRNLIQRTAAVSLVVLCAVVVKADAQTKGACCVHSTSQLDALMNPVRGGDEKFFTSTAGTPNVVFVIDTSKRIRGWARPWPETQGCDHPEINDLGYNPNYPAAPPAYPPMWQNLNVLDTNWFDNTSYYELLLDGYGVNFNNKPPGTQYGTTADACSGLGAGCATCLSERGYYIESAGKGRLAGNFLNFYAPRDSGAVLVLNRLVADLKNVRFATVGPKFTGAGATCWANPNCVCKLTDFNPKCGNASDPSSTITQLRKLEFGDSATAGNACLGEPVGSSLLFAAASYFRSSSPEAFDTLFPGCTGCTHKAFTESNSTGLAICADCEFASIIYISAGDGEANNSKIKLPAEIDAVSVTCPGCADPDLPKVAKFFWENDIRHDAAFPRRNKVATYTIGFMSPAQSPQDEMILKRTALVGGGKYYRATSTSQLREAIMEALEDIASRAASFSNASLASVQTSSGETTAIIPRMTPESQGPWWGELYRFKQYNEFVEDNDLNADSDKDDVFILDKDGDPVAEDPDGAFMKKGSSPAKPANPFWEARAEIEAKGHAKRKIWTVVDSSDDGRFTSSDKMIELDPTLHAALAPYLGILGTAHCPTPGSTGRILDRFGFTTHADAVAALPAAIRPTLSALPTQAELDELCVKVLIQYVRGQDLGDEDADDDRAETRRSVLGDIFHSSPVLVDPPVDRFICDLGLHNQCVRTLYASDIELNGVPATKSDDTEVPASVTVGSCKVEFVAGYDKYRHESRNRERLVLVGSNDGMLHAFHAGSLNAETCDTGFLISDYDQGTGEELWAFLPPDQLPRLVNTLYGHSYMMDGDIMVRDIWADENKDGVKQADEFHTVAIVSEGRGGVHYFALELPFTGNPADGAKAAATQPNFRWMFPQPCSDEAALFGKTLLSISPRPPPIGPVLINTKNSSNSDVGIVNSGGETKRYDVETVERWVAFLSGGWSPGREKGRGVYMVDAWWGSLSDSSEGGISGARADNLWWKLEFDHTASGEQAGPQASLSSSVVAPVAMVDYGANTDPKFDGFFDTGFVGDTAGQLWALRFFAPGTLDASTGLVSNWAAGRAFQMDKEGGDSITNRSPFFFLTSVGLDNRSNLRAMLGSGDRYDLLTRFAGDCQFDNPIACAKYGCSDVQVRYDLARTSIRIDDAQLRWQGRQLTTAEIVRSAASPARDECGNKGDLFTADAPVIAEYQAYAVGVCADLTSPLAPWPASLNQVSVRCGMDAGGHYRCVRSGTSNYRRLGFPNATAMADLGKNRFYGLLAYGGTRVFDETKSSTDVSWKTAAEYDGARLTDRKGGNDYGDLVKANVSSGPEDGSGLGWLYEYEAGTAAEALNRKTASAGTLIGGCALWNVLYPQPPPSSSCPDSRTSRTMLFQADFVTGAADCVAGFQTDRYKERDSSAPPPEPVAILQVSKTHQTRLSVVTQDGTQTDAYKVAENQDVLQSLYELPVSRSLHECRHDGGSCSISSGDSQLLSP